MRSFNTTIFVFLLFLLLNIFYFCIFTVPYMNNYKVEDKWSVASPINTSDHQVYLEYINKINNDKKIELNNNNWGISYLYYGISKITGVDTKEIPIIAFVVSNILIVLCYLIFRSLLCSLGFSSKYSFLFFFNPALIYYSQLITKEIFSLFFVLFFTFCILNKRYLFLLLVLPLSILIRVQLGIYGIALLLFRGRRNYVVKFIFLYVLFSLISALIIKYVHIGVQQNLLGDGPVYLSFILNKQYLIGSLFFNILKLFQYFFDLLKSLWFFYDGTFMVDFYKVRDIPFALIFSFLLYWIVIGISNLKLYKYSKVYDLIFCTYIYILVLFINPLVHSRYLFPISYLIVLIGFFFYREFGIQSKNRTDLTSE